MMKALGLQNKEVVFTFVLESTGIGIIGGVAGLLWNRRRLVDGEHGLWRLVGMDMASFGLPIIGKLYGVWNPAAFIWVFTFVVLTSLWPVFYRPIGGG